ncbi:MAG: NupC/NupG family nucleoside CNT transporter [Phycisphaerales bacterium JB039]
MERWTGILGIAVFIGVAWLLSTNRSAVRWRLVAIGLALQVVLAWLLLTVDVAVWALDGVARVVNGVISSAAAGSEFIFGGLADQAGPWGFIFAVQALPVIIFFGALMAVLYHLGVMQRIVVALAWCLRRTMGISGAEALSVAANIFVGQTEAPLVVRPYIAKFTQSQLALLMTGGFATIAGSVLGAYVIMLGGGEESSRILFAKHLMIASVLSAPAAIVLAKLMVPETEAPVEDSLRIAEQERARNLFEAAAIGTTDGLRLALNVAAMLIAFLALLALINWPLAELSEWRPIADWRAERSLAPFSVQMGLGILFTPLAAIMGVPWDECARFGSLLGEKLFLTEFVAYGHLAELARSEEAPLSPRTVQIGAYALCGFANLPSIGIQIGGIAALAPERRADLASLGLRAMLAGAMASWCTACVASLFIPA